MALSTKQAICFLAVMVFAGCAFASGIGLFISGMVANGVNGRGFSSCYPMKTHENCQNNCGCGWCDYGSEASSCQPIDDDYCANGIFDNVPSERCQEKYNKAILVVIVMGSLTGGFIILAIMTCFISCIEFKNIFMNISNGAFNATARTSIAIKSVFGSVKNTAQTAAAKCSTVEEL